MLKMTIEINIIFYRKGDGIREKIRDGSRDSWIISPLKFAISEIKRRSKILN